MQESAASCTLLFEGLCEWLLAWFDEHARLLPWRRDRTPYRVWVAEVMLQQTRTETVIPYYDRFLACFPTLQALADAELEEVLKVWEGLGYYARARNLHAAARQVMAEHGGRLPGTFEGLRALPGFGPYTAAAVASIAFGYPVVALDGNARRVLTRLFTVEGDPRRAPAAQRLTMLARALLPSHRPGAFNEALMELGATLCRPRAPLCADCPLMYRCLAHRAGQEKMFPRAATRSPRPHYDVTAAVLTRQDGRVLLTRRAADGFLGGLWEFPGGKREEGEDLPQCLEREMREELGIEVEVGEMFLRLKHGYTHFRITLYAFRCRLLHGEPRPLDCAEVRWVAPPEMDDLPMSATDRRIARAVQAESQEGVWKAP